MQKYSIKLNKELLDNYKFSEREFTTKLGVQSINVNTPFIVDLVAPNIYTDIALCWRRFERSKTVKRFLSMMKEI